VGVPNGGASGYGEAEVFDRAFLDQLFDRPRDVLDRYGRIDVVLKEQIDRLELQVLERCPGDGLDVLRAAIAARATFAGVQIDIEAELGRDHDVVSERRQRIAHQFLVDEWAIGFGRIKEGDTPFVGCPDERDLFLFVGGRTVPGTRTHAAKTKSRDLQVASS